MRVDGPGVGNWQVRIAGQGLFIFSVRAKTAIQLTSVRFVEPGGRPGHEGMFPIKRAVHAGEKLTCSITVSGPAKEVHLLFVAGDGTPLSSSDVERVGEDEYSAACVVPSVPYRAGVRGVDTNGRAFQRLMAPLRKPES